MTIEPVFRLAYIHRLLGHVEPVELLLGLTATPERGDGLRC